MRKILLVGFLVLMLSGCGKKEEAKKTMEMEHKGMEMEDKGTEIACTYECCTQDPKCKAVACWNAKMKMCKEAVCPMLNM